MILGSLHRQRLSDDLSFRIRVYLEFLRFDRHSLTFRGDVQMRRPKNPYLAESKERIVALAWTGRCGIGTTEEFEPWVWERSMVGKNKPNAMRFAALIGRTALKEQALHPPIGGSLLKLLGHMFRARPPNLNLCVRGIRMQT